jgi:hypothetical protein
MMMMMTRLTRNKEKKTKSKPGSHFSFSTPHQEREKEHQSYNIYTAMMASIFKSWDVCCCCLSFVYGQTNSSGAAQPAVRRVLQACVVSSPWRNSLTARWLEKGGKRNKTGEREKRPCLPRLYYTLKRKKKTITRERRTSRRRNFFSQ